MPIRHAVAVPLLVAFVPLAAAAPVRAATYTILTTADDAVVNGNCTLREALRASDTDTPVDACPAGDAADRILLPPGTYPFAGEEAQSGVQSLVIEGQTLDPFDVKIELGSADRFLALSFGGTYAIRGVEIAHGWVGGGERGGAILADNVALSLADFRLVGNRAALSGGAIWHQGFGPGQSLTLARGALISNEVSGADPGTRRGGAIYAYASLGAIADLRDLAFLGNRVSQTAVAAPQSAEGGALDLTVESAGTVGRCVRCLFQGNQALNTSTDVNAAARGGALSGQLVDSARLELVDARLVQNSTSSIGANGVQVPALSLRIGTATSAHVERAFVDDNGASSAALARDVSLFFLGDGQVLLADSQITFGTGDGLWIEAPAGSVELSHLTVADYPNQGIEVDASPSATIDLHNSILAFNGTDLQVVAGAVGQVANRIGGDPGFLNHGIGDYHLAVGSPAIDAGNGALASVRFADLDHRARRAGAATDQGCYETGALFADDFEVGDAGAWSSGTP